MPPLPRRAQRVRRGRRDKSRGQPEHLPCALRCATGVLHQNECRSRSEPAAPIGENGQGGMWCEFKDVPKDDAVFFCEGKGGGGAGAVVVLGRRRDGVRNNGWMPAFSFPRRPRLVPRRFASIDGPSRCDVALRATGVRKRCALAPPYGRCWDAHHTTHTCACLPATKQNTQTNGSRGATALHDASRRRSRSGRA